MFYFELTFFISSSEIVIDCLLLGAAGNNIIIKLAPSSVTFWIYKHNIVATVVIPTVNQDGVESISGWRRLGCLQIRIQIQLVVKFESATQKNC